MYAGSAVKGVLEIYVMKSGVISALRGRKTLARYSLIAAEPTVAPIASVTAIANSGRVAAIAAGIAPAAIGGYDYDDWRDNHPISPAAIGGQAIDGALSPTAIARNTARRITTTVIATVMAISPAAMAATVIARIVPGATSLVSATIITMVVTITSAVMTPIVAIATSIATAIMSAIPAIIVRTLIVALAAR